MNQTKNVYYFNTQEKLATFRFSQTLTKLIADNYADSRHLVILCIGSDRVTGDSLGPLIGYKLSRKRIANLIIYGTLDQPVHALNLDETIAEIESKFPKAFIVAIDASLGTGRHIGYISLGEGCIHPGSGVHKELTAVGDIYITGIVNLSGMLENMVLQTTRLCTVMNIADCITLGIQLASIHLSDFQRKREEAAVCGDTLF